MSGAANPYIAGMPLRGGAGFFGRQDTLDWVARELRNPATNALVLFGQRRIGKTTLLLQLQRLLSNQEFLTAYFDLQDQAGRPLGTVLADLAETLTDRARLEPPDRARFDDDGRFFRREFLPHLYTALGDQRRPVLLLDEFDVLEQAAEAELQGSAAARALFPFLRSLMTLESRLAYVFVVGRRAEDLSVDFSATFKASLSREIWVLNSENAQQIVRQAEANGTLRFAEAAVARILNLTSGHPYLTQLLCQRVWERAHHDNPEFAPQIDGAEVEAAVPDALEVGGQALSWLWNGLAPAERIYAAALAEVAEEGLRISEDRAIQVLATHAPRLRTREVELAPRDLVNRHILGGNREDGYRFEVELFRRWVRQNKPLREVKDELDRIVPTAERIYAIGHDYFGRQQWQEAVQYFQRALALNPQHLRARLELGEALLELGQIDAAAEELAKAFILDHQEAHFPLVRALIAQAQVREQERRDADALAIARQVLELSPNEAVAWRIYIAVHERVGKQHAENARWTEAIQAYEQLGHVPRDLQHPKWKRSLDAWREEARLADFFVEGRRALDTKDWKRAQGAFVQIVQRRADYEKDGELATNLLNRATQELTRRKSMRARLLPYLLGGGVLMAVAILLVFANSSGIGATPTATASATNTPTAPPSITPTLTATATPSFTPTSTLTESSTPTRTSTATPTSSPTVFRTRTPTFTPTATAPPTQPPVDRQPPTPTSGFTPPPTPKP